MRPSSALLVLFAVADLPAVCFGRPAVGAKNIHQPNTAVFASAICNTSDIVSMLGKGGPLTGDERPSRSGSAASGANRGL